MPGGGGRSLPPACFEKGAVSSAKTDPGKKEERKK